MNKVQETDRMQLGFRLLLIDKPSAIIGLVSSFVVLSGWNCPVKVVKAAMLQCTSEGAAIGRRFHFHYLVNYIIS